MNHYFKRTFTALLLLLSANALDGQTYFSIIVGASFMEMQEGRNLDDITFRPFMEEGWVSNWHLGLGAERHLTDKYLLAWQNTYIHQQYFKFWPHGIVAITGTKFSVWRSALALKRELFDRVVLGIGPSLDYFHEINFITGSGYEFDAFYNDNLGYAAHISAAFYYKRYMIELSYFKGLGYRSDYSRFIAPADALSLSFIVQFKAPWSGKGRQGMELRF
jgi:hypothetical protein